MLQVLAKFVEGAIHSYRQTCKRARNCLDGLVAKTYTVEKKKRWFGKDVYEVNIFGEHKLNHDTPENMLEIFLRDDKISPMDYQLLKFYDSSLAIDKFVEDILSRKTDKNTYPLEADQIGLLNEISSFKELDNITKEEILDGIRL